MVDLDVLLGLALAASLCIDLQVVDVVEGRLGCCLLVVLIEARFLHTTQRLLRLRLVVNVEVGAMRRLDSDHKARLASLLVHVVVPDGQLLEVLVCHIGVLRKIRISEDLLFLSFEHFCKFIDLLLHQF